MSVRKSSHGTIFLIVASGSPRALIASSLRSTSKKPFCPMTRSLHPPMTACGHRVRFVATWREEFFEVPSSEFGGTGLTKPGDIAKGDEPYKAHQPDNPCQVAVVRTRQAPGNDCAPDHSQEDENV